MYTRKELDVYYKALGIETGEEEQRQAMNKIFGNTEEDPKDKRIRELESELEVYREESNSNGNEAETTNHQKEN